MAYQRKSAASAVIGVLALSGAAGSASAVSVSEEAPRPLFRIEDDRIAESSGLVASSDGRVLFTLEDAGKEAAVYAVDLTGTTRLTVELPQVQNEDWEDIDRGVDDQGRPALFVADTGDAYFVRRDTGAPARTEFAVLRFTEPAVDLSGPTQTATAQDLVRYPLVYEDGAPRNSEALAVQPGTNRVFVVDKVEEVGSTSYVWVAPSEMDASGPNTLVRVGQLPVPEATAAAFSPDGDLFVVRNYRSAFVWAVADDDLAVALRLRPTVFTLPTQPQGEGLAFTPAGNTLVLSSEGADSLVWEVPLPPGTRPEVVVAPVESTRPADDDADTTLMWVLVAAAVGALALGGAELRAVMRRRRHAS